MPLYGETTDIWLERAFTGSLLVQLKEAGHRSRATRGTNDLAIDGHFPGCVNCTLLADGDKPSMPAVISLPPPLYVWNRLPPLMRRRNASRWQWSLSWGSRFRPAAFPISSRVSLNWKCAGEHGISLVVEVIDSESAAKILRTRLVERI
jgi:hypothetical protein